MNTDERHELAMILLSCATGLLFGGAVLLALIFWS